MRNYQYAVESSPNTIVRKPTSCMKKTDHCCPDWWIGNDWWIGGRYVPTWEPWVKEEAGTIISSKGTDVAQQMVRAKLH